MKKLDLRNGANKALLAEFERHLQTLNYSKDTVYNANNGVKEYLHFLELKDVLLREVTTELRDFFKYLEQRGNQRTDGGLSVAYLHKHRSFLKLFYTFLSLNESIETPWFPSLAKAKSRPKALRVDEIKKLFNACDNSLLGKRNKALLAVYYGLGLRRKEGAELCLEDLDFSKEEVFVAKSKTHRQRIVPMSDHVRGILEDYVFNVREKLIPEDKSTATLLVTEHGKPLSVETVAYVVRKLNKESKIKTHASVHTLRHSIATHLLQGGMKLESIALFLGHRSLDSTQIYTHLAEGRPANKTITKTEENGL